MRVNHQWVEKRAGPEEERVHTTLIITGSKTLAPTSYKEALGVLERNL